MIRIGCDAITVFLIFIYCTEGESSAPVSSSQCYWLAQHHKQLIPQNFQWYYQLNISLSIVSVHKGFLLTVLVQGDYRSNKVSVTLNYIRWLLWDYLLDYKPQNHCLFDGKAGTRMFRHCNTWNNASSRCKVMFRCNAK